VLQDVMTMPTEYTITNVVEDTGRDLWHITYQSTGGELRHHVFPKSTLDWRAAEYGIDPSDTATLLDIVLHEPFVPNPDDPVTGTDDPAAAAGLVSPAPSISRSVLSGDLIPLVPTTLYTAESVEQAREAHLLRIQHAKTSRARISAPKGRQDPLAPIRQRGVDPERVAVLADQVDRLRRRLKGERVPDRDALSLPQDDALARRAKEARDA
jgi:hypothetical protein